MKSYFKINNLKNNIKNIKTGDKSISHRSIIYSIIKKQIIEVSNFLESTDLLSTINLFKNLNLCIYGPINNYILISNFKKKKNNNNINFIGNSGTTIRISLSLLLKNNILIGDKSLNNRTMYRIIKPLSLMGFIIQCKKNFLTPLIIIKKNNFGLKYNLINISSQVKSCLLIHSVYSFIKIYLIEKKKTRDHSERLFHLINNQKKCILLKIPNDISSLTFLICNFIIKKKKFILTFNFNKFRIGFFDFLLINNINFFFLNKKIINNEHIVKILFLNFKFTVKTIYSNNISKLIDEIPCLSFFLLNSKNKIKIYGLEELKFKESNRFLNIYNNLLLLGIRTIKKKNYLIFKCSKFHLNFFNTSKDHRLFMSIFISNNFNKISNAENIVSSFPSFLKLFNNKKNKFYVKIK
ncbi:3-phosphoshikimate 1-carboxyvinyltransferase [Candidatus Carsonella ruddii]|uniref:3-phosphoshikimate 1-carboxyvinyltransferase n=1 Tax=Candidatus Carsonella ruddii PC isolate NHV TaxID=1202540 RepID=J3VQN8_CARRU|nr:3-phosphoshikimate 1-carboxyvinyltransferase [Candidatus Carsonella ruddii]AFP84276.1 3-phosphoshikimate 1-carboxyvinyltransferase [Candidatus Carsonella ruddii PC isolate NHV]